MLKKRNISIGNNCQSKPIIRILNKWYSQILILLFWLMGEKSCVIMKFDFYILLLQIQIIIIILFEVMCQCVICDCWWVNLCGIICAGWHWAYCCCSFWLCHPEEMMNIDPDCCKVCTWTGCGQVICCWGGVCFAPDSVKTYSRVKNG